MNEEKTIKTDRDADEVTEVTAEETEAKVEEAGTKYSDIMIRLMSRMEGDGEDEEWMDVAELVESMTAEEIVELSASVGDVGWENDIGLEIKKQARFINNMIHYDSTFVPDEKQRAIMEFKAKKGTLASAYGTHWWREMKTAFISKMEEARVEKQYYELCFEDWIQGIRRNESTRWLKLSIAEAEVESHRTECALVAAERTESFTRSEADRAAFALMDVATLRTDLVEWDSESVELKEMEDLTAAEEAEAKAKPAYKLKETVKRAKKRASTSPASFAIFMLVFLIMCMTSPVNAAVNDAMLANFATFLGADFQAAVKHITDNTQFENFGKMNADLYRMLFYDISDKAGIAIEVQSVVIFLCIMIKSKDRIQKALRANSVLTTNATVVAAQNFIKDHCSDYVTNNPGKFPVVKIPESFSTLAMVYFCGFFENLTMTALLSQQWFGHLKLSEFLQDLHEMFMRFHWTQIVKKTKNTTASRNAVHKVGTFYTEIHENVISDSFPLKTYAGADVATDMVTIENLVNYINALRVTAVTAVGHTAPALAGPQAEVMPPREDWKMFHPKYTRNTVTTTHFEPQITGDYDRNTGAFDATLPDGLLSDWRAQVNARAGEIKRAPAQYKITIDDVVYYDTASGIPLRL